MLLLVAIACHTDRDDDDDNDNDNDREESDTGYVLPAATTGLVGEVSWAATIDGVELCWGLTRVAGTRQNTDCPTCDYSFRMETELVSWEGDTACDVAEAMTWLQVDDAPLFLRHESDRRESQEGYSYSRPDAWFFDYVYTYSSTYMHPTGAIVTEAGFDDYFLTFEDRDHEAVSASETGLRLTMGDFVREYEYSSPWWTWCSDRVPLDRTSALLPTATVEGEVPTREDDVGDVWSVPVVTGDILVVSADHRDPVGAQVWLLLARPDGCVAMQGGENDRCYSDSEDTCPAITWTAYQTGDVHVGIRASTRDDVMADYTLAVEVNGVPVVPIAVADDVTLQTHELARILDVASTAELTWVVE